MDGYIYEIEAAVSESLPMAVLLGTDVPELADILARGFHSKQDKRVQPDEAPVVTTRAARKRKQEAELISEQKQTQSGVEPNQLEPNNPVTVAGGDKEESCISTEEQDLVSLNKDEPETQEETETELTTVMNLNCS